MKRLGFLVLFTLTFNHSYGISDSLQLDTLRIYSVHEVEDSMKRSPKPVIIYYYTDWCKFCKVLNQNTLRDSQIIDSINRNYYFVKFNAESDQEFDFLGRKYKYIKTGNGQGYHEFCYVFDKISAYPSLVFLDEHFELKNIQVGYLKAEEFKILLKE